MPVSSSIRPPEQLHFAHEPDLIHDIFGHLPTLFEPEYRKLLKTWTTEACRHDITDMDRVHYYLNRQLARASQQLPSESISSLELVAKAVENFTDRWPSPSLLWEKLYFWAFEFGIIETKDQLQVLGAGLITSLSELQRLAQHKGPFKQLDSATIFASYHIASQQDGYHTVTGPEHYSSLITAVADRLSSPAASSIRGFAHA